MARGGNSGIPENGEGEQLTETKASGANLTPSFSSYEFYPGLSDSSVL